MQELKLGFRHGLGDCIHFARYLQLYRKRGWDITIDGEENKRLVWQNAGVNFVSSGTYPHHPWGYSGSFFDLTKPDSQHNKIAHNITDPAVPNIGEQERLWQEVCDVRMDDKLIQNEESRNEAANFVKGLRRPILCLHTQGTNWTEKKSLNIETSFNLIKLILSELHGSVVVLDFDNREPFLSSEHVKGIKPSWGHIGLDRMCALFSQSDLIIGVDSGPFHVAALVDTPSLGIFRQIPPVRCCLPHPRSSYLVSNSDREQYDKRDPKLWNFQYYQGPEPSPPEILTAARNCLHSIQTSVRTDTERAAGIYLYTRVGHDERFIEFLPGGKIGVGNGNCERSWYETGEQIVISGDKGPTCILQKEESIWRGTWLHYERMPIILKKGIAMSQMRFSRATIQQLYQGTDTGFKPEWKVGSRNNGFWWAIDESINRSDLDLTDHEDWIYRFLNVPEGGVYVDVGGFVGTHAIRVAAQRKCRVYAFEPLQEHIDLFHANIQLNEDYPYVNDIEIIPRVVSVGVGKVSMVHAGPNSYIDTTKAGDDLTLSLDQYFLSHGEPKVDRIDIIKIDVEGWECNVLEGAIQITDRFKPTFIVEVHSHLDQFGNNGNLIVEWCERRNYKCDHIWHNTPAYYYVRLSPK